MKNILAIDTCNEYLSLALSARGVNYTFLEKVGSRQSESILPQISLLMSQANLTPKQLDLIAFNQGPGSFTGLRIGLGIALGLAYSIGCDLVPLPAFAFYLLHESKVPDTKSKSTQYTLVTLDARLNQLYVAVIDQTAHNYLIPPNLINPEELVPLLVQYNKINPYNTLITGNGFNVYKDKFDSTINDYPYLEQTYPAPETMLKLLQTGNYPSCSVFDAKLLYLRNKVALNLEEQQKNKNK